MYSSLEKALMQKINWKLLAFRQGKQDPLETEDKIRYEKDIDPIPRSKSDMKTFI